MTPGAPPTVLAHPDESLLAKAVAARLVTRLVDVQAARGAASVVLTGGGIGTRVLAQMAAAPARDAVDWRRLDVWWGDERYLPDGDTDRNETAARAALLDHVNVRPERVHAMPASDGPDAGPEAGAERYADLLRAAARPEDHGPVPSFDVLMLGIGPDGHVASLFPGLPAVYEDERPVVAVRGAPKPPPTRISLTFPAIAAAREVWIIASGEEKAAAVRMALSGEAGAIQLPAAGARARQSTLFLVDHAAASHLPAPMLERGRI